MNIVFDIGNVLIAWDLHRAFDDALPEPEAFTEFLRRSDFLALNLRADGGCRFADLAAELPDAADAALVARYPSRFAETVRHKIPGSWQILQELRDRGHRIHAITNWSAETWPAALQLHPELAQVFEVTVVSGHEGVIKPDREIFARLCQRAGAEPGDCLFIDDAAKNVAGARAAGLQALRFVGPSVLRQDLLARGLL